MAQLCIAQDPDADAVLSSSAFALVTGMLLDQQYPMEHAFRGPWKIQSRLGSCDPRDILAMPEAEFEDLCAQTPAIHRYARSMARRIRALAQVVVEDYDGDAAQIWTDVSAEDLLKRLKALPGFGEQKARIFAALLGKQLGVRPYGWRSTIGDYAKDSGHRSVADVTGPEALEKVRAYKKQQKAAKKAAKS